MKVIEMRGFVTQRYRENIMVAVDDKKLIWRIKKEFSQHYVTRLN